MHRSDTDSSFQNEWSEGSTADSVNGVEALTQDSSSDDWIEKIIEFAVDLYQEKYTSTLVSDAFHLENMADLQEEAVHKAIVSYEQKRCAYLALYVGFEEKFISKALTQQEATDEAIGLITAFATPDDAEGFEQYITEYFTENFNYTLDSNQNMFP